MKEAQFPTIPKLACKYFPVQAISVSSERIFSVAGNTIAVKHNRLNFEKLRELVFLHECEKYGLW